MEKQTESRKEGNGEKLRIRCPSCSKLYEVEDQDIQSTSPQFQCVSCHCRFTFEYPPVDPQNIVCVSLDADSHKQIDEIMKSQRSCPKCGALSPKDAEECYSCHVIFSRLEGLPQDPTLRAQPSLVRKWKLLVEDFENENLHEDFIHSCQELEALSFALSKYQDMKQAMGGDAVCERMLIRLQALIDHEMRAPKATLAAAPQQRSTLAVWVSRWNQWKKYLVYAPYLLSALLILWGSLSLGHRNLVGLGVATACLATGLILTLRGRLWH